MSSSAKFSCVNAKISSMEGKLLKKEEYERLISFGAVRKVIEFLIENTTFKDVFLGKENENFNRSQLEYIFNMEILKELKKLSFYLSPEYKNIFKAYLMKYEINDIRLLLRIFATEKDKTDIEKEFTHIKRFENVDFNALLNASNFNEFIDLFKGTIYEDAFRSITKEDAKVREFHAEMNLDFIYFKNILKYADSLPSKDKKLINKMVGVNIDLINLLWIYRTQKYYKISNEEILNYSLSGGYRLNFNKLKNIVYKSDSEGIKSAVKDTKYASIFDSDDIYLRIEKSRYLLNDYIKLARENPFTFASLLAYSFKLECEVSNIISITEGTKYKFNDLNKFLVLSA